MTDCATYDLTKLRDLVEEKYYTNRRFANATGYKYNAVVAKLNGYREISRHDIIVWSEVLKIPKTQIYSYFFEKKVTKMGTKNE